jgi:sugar phosphate isomerase/epimerase
MYSRRDFGKVALAGLSASLLPTRALTADTRALATVRGVKLGAITGAYGPFTVQPGEDVVDAVLAISRQYGVGHVELVNSLIEPPLGGACAPAARAGGPGGPGGTPNAGGPAPAQAAPGGGAPGGGTPGAGGGRAGRAGGGGNPCGVGGQVPAVIPAGYEEARDGLRQWRLKAPLDRFRQIRKKFDAAGVDLFSYVMTIGDDFTEAEIDAVYKHMQALGVDKFCTNQTRVGMAERFAPFSNKYKIKAAFHTHQQSQDPNEVSSPESLAKVLGMSKYFMVNLDIGWYFDGGNDPLAYLLAHPDRITHLHVRDRAAGGGQADVGEGILQIDQMLKTVRDKKYDIAFILEQAGRTGAADRNIGVQQNLEWMKKVLLA